MGNIAKPVRLCTTTYNRIDMVKPSVMSWLDQLDESLYELYIIDNGSTDGTAEWVEEVARSTPHVSAILVSQNLGTAIALNLGWRGAKEGQCLGKLDSDIVLNTPGVLSRMMAVFDAMPDVGILGLRRKDLIEHPNHENPWYQSQYLYPKINDEVIWLEQCHHIMGSFQVYNDATLGKFGYLVQPSLYGWDDALASIRMTKLGFRNCFLRGWDDVEVSISHIDHGEGDGTDVANAEYTRWKHIHAGDTYDKYMQMASDYAEGRRPCYEGFDADVYREHIIRVVE